MDINEGKIKEEVSSFVSSLQRLLPKKKNLIVIKPRKVRLTRLTDVHAEAKSVFPTCFVGAKLVILREIMEKVKLAQQYNFGKTKESYKCFSQFLHKELDPKSADDGLILDSAGSATATYTEVLDGEYEIRLTSRIRDLISSEAQLVFEKEGVKNVGTLSCSLKDVDPQTLHLVTQWMYKIYPNVSVGTEISFKPLASPLAPGYSISARYDLPALTLSTTLSKTGFQVCMFKQFAPDLRIATIVNESYRGGPLTLSLALNKSYMNGSELKMFVDSQRCGGFTYQKDILFYEPQNEVRVLRLIGSTLIDRQRRVRFGVGFNLDF